MSSVINAFSGGQVRCWTETNTDSPLIVSPLSSEKDLEFIPWAQEHPEEIADAVKEWGAVMFKGFKGLSGEKFSDAFEAATGGPPQLYKGDTPRDEVYPNIYKSTAVYPSHNIPPHQEVSGGPRKNMPKFISFFCVSPPTPGTGQTQVASAKSISKDIERLMPDLWKKMQSTTLTYTARYLPSDSWRTKWIRWLNPSHATIQKRFGTEVREEVEDKCREEELDFRWDGGWIVISRSGIPATIDVDGTTVFCNQIYLDRFNRHMCGGWFGGWLNYLFARAILYPTERSMQFDVAFDDGTPISREEAGCLLTIIANHQRGIDWEKNAFLLIDNRSTTHAKTPHSDEYYKREILVALGGSVVEDTQEEIFD